MAGPAARRRLAASGIRLAPVIATVAVALALAAPATAIPATTSISAPANGSLLFAEPATMLTVEGTAGGVAEVDIRCYTANGVESYEQLNDPKAPVKVEGGVFQATLPLSGILAGDCQLRAVPHTASIAGLGPGQEAGEGARFAGPFISISQFIPSPRNFYAVSATSSASMSFESAGLFSFESSLLSTVAHEIEPIFYGEEYMRAYPPIATRPALQVDGQTAFLPEDAVEVEREIKATLPGLPRVTVASHTFDEATRQSTVAEEEPAVRCAPSDAYPPTAESCTSFVPTGVTLVRTLQATHESHLGLLRQAWRSTDAAAHTVNARMFNELRSGTEALAEGGLYRFPGEAAFAATNSGESKTLPAGPGMILYKAGLSVPDAGDGVHPQGVIAYDRAPSEPLSITLGSSNHAKPFLNDFEMPYQEAVPAGGSSTVLRMAFAQSFSLGDAQALAEEALASYHPTVSILTPANGSSIVSSNPTVTVTGTAGDQIALSSLAVNGKAVAVGAGGAWSAALTLSPGANKITALATDQSGLTSAATVAINYAAPPPPASARTAGAPSGRNGKITLTLLCSGVAGQSCKVALNASTLEHLARAHIRSVSARTRRVTVASTTITLKAGQRITISLGLNRTGRRLLARFHKLPLTLKASLLTAAARPTALLSARLTVRPTPKPRRRHR
jgi:hypothetical protein